MQSLGFETLVTTLLPGTLLLLALFFAVVPQPEWQGLLGSVEAHDTLLAVGLLLVAALLGMMLSSVLGLVEEQAYDRLAARRLRVSRAQYLAEWRTYLDALEATRNPYIDRLVLYLFFESRCGTALLLLCWALLSSAHPDNPFSSFWFWPGLLGVFLLIQSFLAHYELARFRHRRFPSPP